MRIVEFKHVEHHTRVFVDMDQLVAVIEVPCREGMRDGPACWLMFHHGADLSVLATPDSVLHMWKNDLPIISPAPDQ
jgi:hypothetical protein